MGDASPTIVPPTISRKLSASSRCWLIVIASRSSRSRGVLVRVHGRRSDEVVHRLRDPARASEGVRQRQRHRPPVLCRHAPARLRIVPDAVDRPVGERARRAQLHLGLRERDTGVRTIAQQDGRRREYVDLLLGHGERGVNGTARKAQRDAVPARQEHAEIAVERR